MDAARFKQLSNAKKLSPREFVELWNYHRGFEDLSPQRVYYYIRKGKIKQSTCDCGRLVIDVVEVTAFFIELGNKS